MKLLKFAAVAAGALALCACTTAQINTGAQEAERLMTEGNQLYVAIQGAAKTAGACSIVPQAWTALVDMRDAYVAGQTITLESLLVIESQLPNAPTPKMTVRKGEAFSVIDIATLIEELLPTAIQLIKDVENTQAANDQMTLDNLYQASVASANAVQPTAAMPCGS